MGLAQSCALLLERGELVLAREVADDIRSIIETGPKGHKATVEALHYAAKTYEQCEELQRAIPLREKLLELESARHGRRSSMTLSAIEYLASDLRKAGDTTRAIELQRDVIQRWCDKEGEDSPQAMRAQERLGIALHDQGDYAEAQAILEHVVQSLRSNHSQARNARLWLASTLIRQDNLEGALRVQEETLSLTERAYGPEDRRTLHDIEQVALTLWSEGRCERAQALLEGALAARERVFGDDDPETETSKQRLSSLLDDLP